MPATKSGNIRGPQGPAGIANIGLGGGSASTPASLGLGSNNTVTVPITWTGTAPTSGNYLATAVIVGGGDLLSNRSIRGITAKTATTVTVSVRTDGLLAVTGTVEVTCFNFTTS